MAWWSNSAPSPTPGQTAPIPFLPGPEAGIDGGRKRDYRPPMIWSAVMLLAAIGLAVIVGAGIRWGGGD